MTKPTLIFSGILFISGLLIVMYSGNAKVALGIILIMWADNIVRKK